MRQASGSTLPWPAYARGFLDPLAPLRQIGRGEPGAKARGLAEIRAALAARLPEGGPHGIVVDIPPLAVVGTQVFDAFLKDNDLGAMAMSEVDDDRITAAFLNADLPVDILGDLRALAQQIETPLAVRSSSLMEDAQTAPLAGVYRTKMVPMDPVSADARFRQLLSAIRFVYASTFSRGARDYRASVGLHDTDEKMGVILQELVGRRHHLRFYPEISGVGRSLNYYPMAPARPEDGVVSLALGLGKTIVDGGRCWAYSPVHPKVEPPFGSVQNLLEGTQTRFWAVHLGDPPVPAPGEEIEYLTLEDLSAAERDGTLAQLASTYSPLSDRLSAGIAFDGPRALTFAPLLVLEQLPFNQTVHGLMQACQQALGSPVEIEFAMTLEPARLRLLQVRPMEALGGDSEIDLTTLRGDQVLVASENTLGHGSRQDLYDIVYTRPESFSLTDTRRIVPQLEAFNRRLLSERRPYLLIVHGRLGTTDPWLGIPAPWAKISGARAVVEATEANVRVELSQGSHFFHNIVNLGVKYFNLPISSPHAVDWEWLGQQPALDQTPFLRLIRLERPLSVHLDGRRRRGLIRKPEPE